MSIVDLEAQTAQTKLHKKPFLVQHQLASHPLFSLERLTALADELPRDFVEFNNFSFVS